MSVSFKLGAWFCSTVGLNQPPYKWEPDGFFSVEICLFS